MRRRRWATGVQREQSDRFRAGSSSDFRQTHSDGDPIVQFPCTNHPPYTPSIVDRSGTDTGLQSDPDETGLLQLGNAPVSSIQKLQRVQNNTARIVLQAPRRSHAKPQMRQLHWLPVQHRIGYKVSVLTYKTLRLHTWTPVYHNTSANGGGRVSASDLLMDVLHMIHRYFLQLNNIQYCNVAPPSNQ